MRSMTFLIVALSLATIPTISSGAPDGPDVYTPPLSNKRPVDLSRCEKVFYARDVQLCRPLPSLEYYSSEEVNEGRGDKKLRELDTSQEVFGL